MNIFTDNFWYRRCFNSSLRHLPRILCISTLVLQNCVDGCVQDAGVRSPLNDEPRAVVTLNSVPSDLKTTLKTAPSNVSPRLCEVLRCVCIVLCCIYIHRALYYTCSRSLRDTAVLQVMSSPPEQILPPHLNIHQHD